MGGAADQEEEEEGGGSPLWVDPGVRSDMSGPADRRCRLTCDPVCPQTAEAQQEATARGPARCQITLLILHVTAGC